MLHDLPLGYYAASDMDDVNPAVRYYGNVARQGQWYIMRHNITEGSFRYTSGDSEYETAWNSRLSLNYDYYNKTSNI